MWKYGELKPDFHHYVGGLNKYLRTYEKNVAGEHKPLANSESDSQTNPAYSSHMTFTSHTKRRPIISHIIFFVAIEFRNWVP